MTVSLNLRLAIAAHYSEEARSRWLAVEQVAWEALAQEAIETRLGPLLYHSLKLFPRSDVPAAVRERLRRVYYATATRNMQMHQQLKRVTDALDEIGVRYILLKGAALIQDVYGGNMALRPMSDIDLLINHADFPPVRQALHTFTRLENVIMDEEHNVAQHARAFYPSRDVRVEIHTRLLRYYHYARRPVIKPFVDAGRLDSNWAFLYLCAHALFHHGGRNPLFGADAAFVLRQGVCWPTIMRLAEANHMVMSLQHGVTTLSNNWFCHIPKKVQPQIEVLQPSKWERFYVSCSRVPALRRLGTWIALPDLRYRASYLRHMIFPSNAYLHDRWADGDELPNIHLYLRRIARIPARLLGKRV